MAAHLSRHLRDRAAQPGPADPLRDPQRARRCRGRAGLRPVGGHGSGHASGRRSPLLPREPPGRRVFRRPGLQSLGRARLHQRAQSDRPGPGPAPCRRPHAGRSHRGGRRALRLQSRAAGRFRGLLRARGRRGGRGGDQRGAGGGPGRADRRHVEGGAAPCPGPPARGLRPGLLRGHLRARAGGGARSPDRGSGPGPETGRGHAQVPRHSGAGGEADHRRPGRVALSAPAAGAAHRGGPRPPQRRVVPRLHPGMPFLPGRDDHPPGAGAPGRAGADHGDGRPGPHRLRRGGPDLAVQCRLLGHRGDGHLDHRRSLLLGTGVGQPPQPAGGRLHRGHRSPDPAGEAHRAHLRPRRRDLADAPGDQQADPRGGSLRRRRCRLQPGVEAGQAVLPDRPAHRDRRGHPGHRRPGQAVCGHRSPLPQRGHGHRLGGRVRAQGPDPFPVVRSEHHRGAHPKGPPPARRGPPGARASPSGGTTPRPPRWRAWSAAGTAGWGR